MNGWVVVLLKSSVSTRDLKQLVVDSSLTKLRVRNLVHFQVKTALEKLSSSLPLPLRIDGNENASNMASVHIRKSMREIDQYNSYTDTLPT